MLKQWKQKNGHRWYNDLVIWFCVYCTCFYAYVTLDLSSLFMCIGIYCIRRFFFQNLCFWVAKNSGIFKPNKNQKKIKLENNGRAWDMGDSNVEVEAWKQGFLGGGGYNIKNENSVLKSRSGDATPPCWPYWYP